ncbi:MAG: ion transporter [Thermoflexibacter sp.]|jgi:voltage-gated sodium channel|nr:ion transporter [Thermoflexibacter sp.]
MKSDSYSKYDKLSKYCEQFVESKIFKRFILSLIILASVLVGLETYEAIETKYHWLFVFTDEIVLFFFCIELIIKVIAEGRHPMNYFKDAWNVFDFIIIISCFIPFASGFAAIFRLVRILRVLRLISALPKLQLLVMALLKSIPSMIYVVFMMGILFYIYAITGTILFKKNDPIHFGTLEKTSLSLFTAITLEDWSDMMYTQIYGSDRYGYNEENIRLVEEKLQLKREPEASPITGVLYFTSFILVGAMVIINMFVGVILNGIDEVKIDLEKKERLKQMEKNATTLYDEIAVLAIKMEDLKNQMDYIKDRLQSEQTKKTSRKNE